MSNKSSYENRAVAHAEAVRRNRLAESFVDEIQQLNLEIELAPRQKEKNATAASSLSSIKSIYADEEAKTKLEAMGVKFTNREKVENENPCKYEILIGARGKPVEGSLRHVLVNQRNFDKAVEPNLAKVIKPIVTTEWKQKISQEPCGQAEVSRA